jgi:IMP dehydrogenase
MLVNQAMTTDVKVIKPAHTIRDAARIMAECDLGSVPVGENDRLVGMVTDRDIAVRAVAEGKSPDTQVREVMSREVKYCFEDDDVDSVARNMADIQLRRLVVVNRDKRLVGILALADVAQCEGAEPAGEAICGISEPTHQAAAGGARSSSGSPKPPSGQRRMP